MARAGYGRGRADQSTDPHGILLLRGLLATVYDWRGWIFGAIHCEPLRAPPCSFDREYEARLSRGPSRRSPLVRVGGLGLPRYRAIAVSDFRACLKPRALRLSIRKAVLGAEVMEKTPHYHRVQ